MREAASDVNATGPATRTNAAPEPLLHARGLCFDAGGKMVNAGVMAFRASAERAAYA